MRARLLAFLLVLAIWPSLGETVELGLHFVEHGDLAHEPGDPHAAVPLGADEHGCSGLFHLCSTGHTSATSAPRAIVAMGAPATVTAPATSPPLDERGCEPPAPPIRPPIATTV